MARKRQRSKGQPPIGKVTRPSKVDARSLLAELHEEWEANQAETGRIVALARSEGMSWREVAELTGLNSAQAAQYRWGRDRPSTK